MLKSNMQKGRMDFAASSTYVEMASDEELHEWRDELQHRVERLKSNAKHRHSIKHILLKPLEISSRNQDT